LDKDGTVCGVKLEDGSTIDADALVIACGPWTEAARNWFGPEVKAKIPRMMDVKVRESKCSTAQISLITNLVIFHLA
jgi:glycine/D-amino acid oxidase-like deaminating enzyme